MVCACSNSPFLFSQISDVEDLKKVMQERENFANVSVVACQCLDLQFHLKGA